MALFKISKGLKANLPSAKTVGYCWYTTDDSLFYIDYEDENGVVQRKALNAKDAETITGASLATILNSSDIEIPTSKAVLDALSNKADMSDIPIVKNSSAGTISLTWDGEIGDNDSFALGTWTYYKISSLAPAYSSVTSGYTFRSNGMQNANISESVNCYAVGDAIVVTTAGICSDRGTQFEAPSTGIYFGRMSGWYTEEFEMDCDISYTSLFTTDVNGTQHVIAVDENNLLSVTDMSSHSTAYMATKSYVDGKIAAIPTPDVSGQIAEHNTSTEAHADIRKTITDVATALKNELLNGAGEAYDTLKELGDLIDDNTDALSALENVATGKQDKLTGTPGQIAGFDANGDLVAKDAVQSDWNQNDENASDYVKNRPFYTGGLVETIILEEQTVNIGSGLDTQLNSNVYFVEGQTYIVNFNGIRYECVTWDDGYGGQCLGSGDVYGYNMEDMGGDEPFCIISYPEDSVIVIVVSSAGNYTVSVSRLEQGIVKIPEEYMPIEEGVVLKDIVVTLPSMSEWYSVTYGNGRFVAVAYNSTTAIYSDDGITWHEASMPSSADWYSVTYGNGRFVTVTFNSNKAAYSDDGITWHETTLPSSAVWNSVTYGNGRFVTTTENSNKVAYSDDGINWNAATLPSLEQWRSVTYGNGRFVTVAYYSRKAAYSDDGINWTETALPSYASWHSVTYGNSRFVTVAQDSTKAAYSDDGITWTETTLPSSAYWSSVTYGNGRFVTIAKYTTGAAYSDDGIAWHEATLPSAEVWQSVTYGDGRFVAVVYFSTTTAYSDDGINWTDKGYYAYQNGEDVTANTISALYHTHNYQSPITGTQGQVVGFDSTGKPVAQDMPIPDAYTKSETYTKSEVDAAIAAAIEAALANIARAEEVAF